MSPAEIFRTYLQRFTSGGTAGAAELLTDDFRFHGPMLQSQGKAAFLESSAPLGLIMRGAEIHRQWEDGGELCSFYDFKIETPAGAGFVQASAEDPRARRLHLRLQGHNLLVGLPHLLVGDRLGGLAVDAMDGQQVLRHG